MFISIFFSKLFPLKKMFFKRKIWFDFFSYLDCLYLLPHVRDPNHSRISDTSAAKLNLLQQLIYCIVPCSLRHMINLHISSTEQYFHSVILIYTTIQKFGVIKKF